MDLSPEGSLEEVRHYVKFAKVTGNMAKGLTLGSLGLDVANTWTADSGNTKFQRIEKTGIQIGGGAICYGVGKGTSYLAGVGFAGIPASGGNSALLIVGAGAIDVGTAAGVTWGEDWLYKKFGIK